MTGQLIKHFGARLARLWFFLFHAPRLQECGRNTFLYSPFRIDGAEHISLGAGTAVQARSWLYCGPVDGEDGHLTIGSGCVLGYNNHITSVRDVVIEDHVLTANNVYISDNLHSYEDIGVPVMFQSVRFKNRVVIGRGSWIGENVCIIGASVGRNCVIGANSVVTHDIPDYSVAAGAPAVVIKQFDQHAQKWVGRSDWSRNGS